MGEGCTLSGSRVKVKHDVVRNAVAFETYNALGEILRITMYGLASDDSHSYTQVLFPTGSDINDISAYIVAVGYDGTRTKIYETSENIPLNLLKKKLTQAKSALNASDPDGAKVGYYKPISIVSLQELVNEVQKAIDNEDTSVHSYEEWLQLLDAELAALAADEMAKIPLYEGSIYTLSNKERTALGHATAGLKVSTSLTPAESPEFHWAFVPTGVKNQYYIQHVSTGLYISVAPESGRIKAEATAVSGAIAFNLIDVDGGKFAIQHSNNANVYIASDASKNVVGTKEMSTNAQWNITLAIDNHSATIKAKLEMLIGKVASTFEELIAATEPELQFHADITVLDEQLPVYVVALQEAYDAAIKGMSEGYAYPADLYTVLKNAYDKVKKAYQKALSLPVATDDAMVTCYYLQCLDTETYAYCFEGSGRYNGTLRANELTNETDRSYWFFLRPGENEGEYYIYNWYTGKPAGTSGRYIYANGTVEPTVYNIAIAEESYGLIISTANGSWNVQSGDNGYVQFTSSPAMWNLIPIGKFDTTGINSVAPTTTGIYYDLLGRPVENPSAGIYIVNGRKVIVK